MVQFHFGKQSLQMCLYWFCVGIPLSLYFTHDFQVSRYIPSPLSRTQTVARAALCEMGRHQDALEEDKEGLWAMTRKSDPKSQKALCWGCEQDVASGWGSDALVAALLCRTGQTSVTFPQVQIKDNKLYSQMVKVPVKSSLLPLGRYSMHEG